MVHGTLSCVSFVSRISMGGDTVHITKKSGLQNHGPWSMVGFQDELRGEYFFS